MTWEALALSGSVVLVGTVSVLGQISPADVDGWKELGALAILGFVVFWLITKTLPDMAKEHRASLKEIVNAFADEQAKNRMDSEKHEERAATRHEKLIEEIRRR
jgi:ABC-type nickel/cobalt efflux system permease component RcnA